MRRDAMGAYCRTHAARLDARRREGTSFRSRLSLPSFCFSLALSLSPLPAAACHVLIICELHTTGKAEVDWVEDYISVSSYPLSGAVAAGKFCNAFEDLWSIL